MPAQLPTEAVDEAHASVAFAQLVRKRHARRSATVSEQRARDIDLALERLRLAMRPLKSAIGGFMYGPQTQVAEENRQTIREASHAIQRERRKLWKMQKATRRKDKAA